MASLASGQSSSVGLEKEEFHRLPKDVVPKSYQVTVDPDLVNFTFTGSVAVTVSVQNETSQLVLNAAELSIKSVTFTASNETQAIPAKAFELNEKDELLVITMPSALPMGSSGVLKIEFVGSLNDKMKGFYRSKCSAKGASSDSYSAVTQFCPCDARRMFPCCDEPAAKATFEITVIAPKNLTVISNMHVVSETEISAEKKGVTFAKSPIMSTYLVAIVVGPYDYVETKTSDGDVVVRVYAPASKRDEGRFALDVASKALTFYTQYFGIPFPLRKMDMIALSDCTFGAMENWGLVTYREARILVDDNNSAASAKQSVAIVVAHELAHQWFGNLVTMEWWTHLWLNEGFATFMQFLAVDALIPEFRIWQQFVSDYSMRALTLDALHTSHPIEVPINHPAEVDEVFDQISYDKGASVIRMLHSYLGDEEFRKGMTLYLTRHAYQNARTEDLWSALSESSGKPVEHLMSSWTKQKGFPLVSVSQTQSGTDRILTVSQSKFSADGKVSDDEKDVKWMIPITVITASSPTKPVTASVLSNLTGNITVPNVSASHWVKLNQDSVGYFRVQYSPDMLTNLLPAIRSKELQPVDRLSLISDLLALVQADHNSTVDFLRLLDAYREEEEYSVWSGIASGLSQIGLILDYTDYQNKFHAWGRNLFASIFSKIGWKQKPDEKHTDSMLRALVLGRLVAYGDSDVITKAKKLFKDHVSGNQVIPADIRAAVYTAVACHASDAEFECLLKVYRDSDQHEEKLRVLRSVAAVTDGTKKQRLLSFAISDEVRSQDIITAIGSVGSSRIGRDMAWSFIQQNRKLLVERYTGSPLLSRLVKSLTEDFATDEKADEVEAYFAANSWPGTERGVQQAVESIRLNAGWLTRDSDAIRQFLR